LLPSVLSEELKTSVRDFLRSAFPVTTPHFRRPDGGTVIDALLDEPGELFRGPYLSVDLPFRASEEAEPPFELVNPGFTPYRHQQLAFERLAPPEPRSTLIATGTGSGKTECFTLPILEYCARERAKGPKGRGIKAIIVYPMNALATDQAGRLADAIYQREALKGLSVGLFIGGAETHPDKSMGPGRVIRCKETLREHPPDILLTNYKMLDYLMVRPKDQPLWQHNVPETLRYLVVDELHTFDGAQGTDLGCLVRRLRQRLDVGPELACVGTSATLGAGEGRDRLLGFAAKVFATDFDGDALIGEERISAAEFLVGQPRDYFTPPSVDERASLNPESYRSQAAYLQAQARLWFGDEAPELDAKDPVQAARACCDLSGLLLTHGLFQDLLGALDDSALVDAEGLVERWQRTFRGEDPVYARLLLASMLALVASARRSRRADGFVTGPDDLVSFLQLKQHLWLRELRRMVADVSREPALRFADDLHDLTNPLHLPVVHCRECHAAGWGSVKKKEEAALDADIQSFYQAYFGNHPDVCLLFPVAEDATQPRQGLIVAFCPNCSQVHPERTEPSCQGCGADDPLRVWMPEMTRAVQRGGSQRVVSHNDCPFCGAREGLSVMGYRATTLGSVMIGRLFASPYNADPPYTEAPNAGKKLIAFSDSVQDAAHRAGFYGANTYRTTVRRAMAGAIADQDEPTPLDGLADNIGSYWRERLGDDAEFVGTLIAPNMAWLRDYRTLRERGQLPEGSDLPKLVSKRLTWELLSEFGLRSRIGRTLERTTTATVAVDADTIDHAASALARQLTEEIEALRGRDQSDFRAFVMGVLWRMRTQGAFYHSFLDGYIREGGNEYLLNKLKFMPGFGRAARPPSFVAMDATDRHFEGVARPGGWYENWFKKTLAVDDSFMAAAEFRQAYEITIAQLERDGVLVPLTSKGKPVWGLDPGRWLVTDAVAELVCQTCRHRIQAPRDEATAWRGLPCLRPTCAGEYAQDPSPNARARYGHDTPRRLVPAEHSALLDSTERDQVERSFIHGDRPWDVNLLSATPTLEMGIDIGDLSTVLLASVPPAQANYRQRTGRAGRRDGNALNVTIANGQSHDLYFFAQPEEMVAGPIRPPGVFLEATAVLERQLLAFCFDRWAASGIEASAIPATLKTALDAVEAEDRTRFPYPLIDFVAGSQVAIFNDFCRLFPDLPEAARSHLETHLFGGEAEGGWAYKMVSRLVALVSQRKDWRKRVDQLKREISRVEAQPQDDANREILAGLRDERSALQNVMKDVNAKPTLNFFTDEGLLPNYAFPEEGITLQSVIFRREERDESAEVTQAQTVYEFTRPAQAALRELAPANRFYAVGHQLQIDQVDLKKSETETWRVCDNCHCSVNLSSRTRPCPSVSSTCPRPASARSISASRTPNARRSVLPGICWGGAASRYAVTAARSRCRAASARTNSRTPIPAG